MGVGYGRVDAFLSGSEGLRLCTRHGYGGGASPKGACRWPGEWPSRCQSSLVHGRSHQSTGRSRPHGLSCEPPPSCGRPGSFWSDWVGCAGSVKPHVKAGEPPSRP